MKKYEHFIFEISAATVFKIIAVFVLCWVLYMLRNTLLLVLAAVVFASALEPMIVWFEKRHLPRLAGVILIYLFLLGVALSIVYFVVPTLLHEVALVINQLPRYIDTFQSTADEFSLLSFDLKTRLSELSNADITSIGGIISALGGGVIESAGFLFGGLFGLILILVLSFYLAVQKGGIENFLRMITHEDYEEYVLDLWARAQQKIALWMQGQLVLGLCMGLFVYVGLSLLGVKYALLLALLAMVCELIPVFGPVFAAVPAVAVALLESAPLGFLVLGFYVAIQQIENHVVYPLVVRKIVGVSPLLVILAIIVGGELGGFLGVLLSVPLATVLMEVLADIEKYKSLRRAAEVAQ